MKKSFGFFICLMAVLCAMLAFAAAAQAEIASGNDNGRAWTLADDGTLTISSSDERGSQTWTDYKDTIKKVIIKGGIKGIRNREFYGYKSLTSVTLSDSVTYIYDEAFAYCSNLTSVTIPNSVTSIGSYAFHGCSSLTSVTIPNSVTSIGSYTFAGCSSLTSVTIPNSVTSINSYAFYNCSSLTSVTIPNSVTSIGSYALAFCSSLTSVTIPNSVTSIDSYAFYNCSSLTSVTIPNSVTSIGSYAFAFCSSLTSVTIPNSVTSINSYAFYNCSSLTSVTIPGSMTCINSHVFDGCSSLISVKIPGSVTIIGAYAFGHCSSLKSVTIPNSVTTIGNGAFNNCSALTSVTVPGSVTSIGSYAFSDCSSLGSVTIPNSVTGISEGAFSGCESLTSVTIPNSVTSIGSKAFNNCSSLTSVTIPNSVTSIDSYAFHKCGSLTSVTIPNSVTSISEGVFAYCSSLTSVTIPDSVTSIGRKAFEFCTSLRSVMLPNGLTSIGERAFYNCSRDLMFRTLPSSLTNIGPEALPAPLFTTTGTLVDEYCKSTGILCFLLDNMPGGKYETVSWSINEDLVLTIKGNILPDRSSDMPWEKYSRYIKKIVLEDVTRIGKHVFENYDLISVVIPDSVTKIDDYAFCGCRSLRSVTIPNSVKSIGSRAFSKCGLYSVVIPDSVTSIGAYAFLDCRLLHSVTLSPRCSAIGALCFQDCTALTSVTIPNGVTYIGSSAFKGCTALTSVTIPNSVSIISDEAFSGCRSLSTVTIPTSVTNLSYDAFPYATTLYCLKDSNTYTAATRLGYTVVPVELTITGQPLSCESALNSVASFNIAVKGTGLKYQWQYQTPTSSWKNTTATGCKTDTLSVDVAATKNGYQYRCIVTDQYGYTITSEAATLTACKAISAVKQPEDAFAKDGTTAVFTASFNGTELTYQWKYRTATGNWQNATAPGNKTDTLNVPVTAAKNGYLYCCEVTDKNGNSATSGSAVLYVCNDPKITAQPKVQSVKNGTNAAFNVAATGMKLTYQWQYRASANGTWANTSATGNKTDTLTVATTLAKNGYQYRCIIKDPLGQTVTSNAATLTVDPALSIATQPAAKTVKDGTNANFTVTAKGGGLTYQWQYRASANGTWANTSATGNKTATLTIAATAAKNGYQYHCVIKDKYGASVTSNAATLTVDPVLSIATQPSAKTVKDGANANFTVAAKGGGLTYQWQYRASANGTWANTSATGCKTATLTIAATTSKKGYQYHCVIKDRYGASVTSNAATLTVDPELKITAQPAGKTAKDGENAVFKVTAQGGGLTYQWQYRASSTAKWTNTTATGCKTASLTIAVTSTKNGYQYQCIIKDKYGASVTSNAATLTVAKPLKITAQPADRTVTAGTDAKFTVTASGTGLTYQWQYRASATGKWNNTSATGCKTATLTVATTAAKNGYQYQCIIKDFSGASVTTKEATLTVE